MAMREGALDFLAAGRPRSPADDGRARARAAPDDDREPDPRRASRAGAARRRSSETTRSPTGAASRTARRGPMRRTARRRERHGQRVVCARCTRQSARRRPFVAINRRDSREPARDRALRTREGRVHRRRRAQAREVRARASRHPVSRRDRRSAPGASGEDPARAGREELRSRRRHGAGPGRRPRRRGDEPQSESGGRRAAVSRGSLLPPVRCRLRSRRCGSASRTS